MTDHLHKIAVVLDASMPSGLAANTAAVLTLSLGCHVGSSIGPALRDADGSLHVGITSIPIPVLTADGDNIKEIRNRAVAVDGLIVVDFTNVAQRTRNYEDYSRQLESSTDHDLAYLGVALYGPRKQVQRLTGSLPLMR